MNQREVFHKWIDENWGKGATPLWYYGYDCPKCKAGMGKWCLGNAETPPCPIRVRLYEQLGPAGTKQPEELILKMIEATANEEE